jgi:hypothetical protein
MTRVAVIGPAVRVMGYRLAGALVFPADEAGQARAAWESLPPGVEVVVLSPEAARWLSSALQPGVTGPGVTGPGVTGPGGVAPGAAQPRPGVLTVVMPP